MSIVCDKSGESSDSPSVSSDPSWLSIVGAILLPSVTTLIVMGGIREAQEAGWTNPFWGLVVATLYGIFATIKWYKAVTVATATKRVSEARLDLLIRKDEEQAKIERLYLALIPSEKAKKLENLRPREAPDKLPEVRCGETSVVMEDEPDYAG